MARLKNRQRQIPYGFKFKIPELGYDAAPFQSFDTIVNAATRILNANPDVASKHGYPTTAKEVADWVDEYNADICQRIGWNDFFIAGTSTYVQSPVPQKVGALGPDGWPVLARSMWALRNQSDRGVGDTVERIIGVEASNAFKEWYKSMTGQDCKCSGRKRLLNNRYPYK